MDPLPQPTDAMKAGGPARAVRGAAARLLTLLRVLAVPPFLWLFVEASQGSGGARAGLALLFACVALSDSLDGRLARAAGGATPVWGVIDVCADILFNVAVLGIAAWYGMIGPWVPAGVVILGARYLLRVVPTLVADAAPARYDRLGHAAGVTFYVLAGLIVAHVVIGIPGPGWLRVFADAVFVYTLLVLGVRVGSRGKSSA